MARYVRSPASTPQGIKELVDAYNPGPFPPPFHPPGPAPQGPPGTPPQMMPPLEPMPAAGGSGAFGAALGAGSLLIPQEIGPEWPEGVPPHRVYRRAVGPSPLPVAPAPAGQADVPRGTFRKMARPAAAYNRYEDPDWVHDNLATPDPNPQRFLVPGTPSLDQTPEMDPDSPAGKKLYRKLLRKLEQGTE